MEGNPLKKLQELAQKAKDKGFNPESKEVPDIKKETRTYFEAAEIMGESFYGVGAVEKTFGVRITPDKIPSIPFSKAELERAKQLGQELILYVDKNSEGKPLTAIEINRLCERNENDSFSITDNYWFKDDEYLKNMTPRMGWRLSGKEPIPGCTEFSYLQQTDVIARYLENSIFPEEVPKLYQDAIDNFKETRKDKELLVHSSDNGNRFYVARELTDIPLNQLCRENFTEVLYRLALHRHKTGSFLLSYESNVCLTLTNSFTKTGQIVSVGNSTDTFGVNVGMCSMKIPNSDVSVCFSRGA
jgi:hypothetical protein